jgi:hypothetical protein
MPGLPEKVARNFYDLCSFAYGAWTLRRSMFDANPRDKELRESERTGVVWTFLSKVTGDYALLQIAKLHDPAEQSGRANLGLAYVIEKGDWSDDTRGKLEALRADLEALLGLENKKGPRGSAANDSLKQARKWTLCHNDLDTVIEDANLGAFVEGADKDYFNKLQEFVDRVSIETSGTTHLIIPADDGVWRFVAEIKQQA